MTRNIGLAVKEPKGKKKIDPNDKNNPFNGTLSIRGKLFEGIVVSAKAKNTIVIEKDSPLYFTKFKRYARGKSRIHAHVPSNIEVEEGDKVLAAECRPLAKSVSFVVVEVKS
jgi:small subunit ribosomal protein S17